MSVAAITVKLVEAAFEPGPALDAFAAAHMESGAVASFLGQTRKDANGEPVRALELQHYPGFTEAAIERLCKTAHDRWPLDGVLVIHRYGEMAPGDPIVLVAAAARHRRAALAATEFLIDRLKTDAPFWKKEVTAAGEQWIEPTSDDYARTAGSRPD